LNLFSRTVYLHAGTRTGARALGFAARAATLDVSELPAEFHALEPHEVEDVLCIFKGKFASSRRTAPTLSPLGEAGSDSPVSLLIPFIVSDHCFDAIYGID
jgi:hypothetical protein